MSTQPQAGRDPGVSDAEWQAFPDKSRRKAIPATCGRHRGAIGFANLLVSMQSMWIVLDPHVTGFCVIVLDEEGAKALRDILMEWLG
jgi:hypothetical protein